MRNVTKCIDSYSVQNIRTTDTECQISERALILNHFSIIISSPYMVVLNGRTRCNWLQSSNSSYWFTHSGLVCFRRRAIFNSWNLVSNGFPAWKMYWIGGQRIELFLINCSVPWNEDKLAKFSSALFIYLIDKHQSKHQMHIYRRIVLGCRLFIRLCSKLRVKLAMFEWLLIMTSSWVFSTIEINSNNLNNTYWYDNVQSNDKFSHHIYWRNVHRNKMCNM